jgi:23S rRNA (cytidine1920-2'-O)/16S rRNA (cytidine1409-2'-O)-methyltransferase
MSGEDEKLRLDQALVSRGLVVSRARARDLILRREVTVNGEMCAKVAQRVDATAILAVTPGAGDYVSRGAIKLRAALDAFRFDATGLVALDVGASTGGFTEVLLARGAAKVYAVDNGVGQLHTSLRADPRVVSLEAQDARRLTLAQVPDPIRAIVADVSFISLTKVLPAAMALSAPGCWLVGLIKPQFEAERTWIPKDGVITDPDVHADTVALVEAWFAEQTGWTTVGIIESPIKGGDGNTEFLIGAVHDRR